MKKLIGLSAVAMIAFTVTSCIKSRTCECTTVDSQTGTSTFSETIPGTKKTAEATCKLSENSESYTFNGQTYTTKTTCTLK